MNIVIDVILFAIIIICFISGWKKGFIVAVMNTVSFFLAAAGAYFLHGYVADYAYRSIFLPKISGMIASSIDTGKSGIALSELFRDKPQFFTDILNRYSTVGEVEKYYNSKQGLEIRDISEFMAAPIAQTISKILSFIAVFILLVIVLKILTFLLDRVCHLPVLNIANKILGIIFGVLLGLLFAWLLSAAFVALLPKLALIFPDTISENLYDSTVLLKYLYQLNPLTVLHLIQK